MAETNDINFAAVKKNLCGKARDVGKSLAALHFQVFFAGLPFRQRPGSPCPARLALKSGVFTIY
jgi:hypothetical protein